MKEITAIIRMNMVGNTKEALLEAGFPAVTCKKVLGRGRKKVDFSLLDAVFIESIEDKNVVEQITEAHRLIPKRMLTVLVNDEDVEKVVGSIISINRTGNPGDGKIFVTNAVEVIRVRTGETGTSAV
jgi:nitrogen regulatory protein PII 2